MSRSPKKKNIEIPSDPYKKDPLDDVKYPKLEIDGTIKDPLNDVRNRREDDVRN